MTEVLESLAWSVPYFVAIGTGLWISAKHKATHPRLSNTFSLAFILLAVHSILGSASRAWMATHTGLASSASKTQIALIYGVVSGFAAILNYAGWAILLLAIHRAFQEMSRLSGGETLDARKDG